MGALLSCPWDQYENKDSMLTLLTNHIWKKNSKYCFSSVSYFRNISISKSFLKWCIHYDWILLICMQRHWWYNVCISNFWASLQVELCHILIELLSFNLKLCLKFVVYVFFNDFAQNLKLTVRLFHLDYIRHIRGFISIYIYLLCRPVWRSG